MFHCTNESIDWNMNFSETYNSRGDLWKVWFSIFDVSKKLSEGYPTEPIPGGKYNS